MERWQAVFALALGVSLGPGCAFFGLAEEIEPPSPDADAPIAGPTVEELCGGRGRIELDSATHIELLCSDRSFLDVPCSLVLGDALDSLVGLECVNGIDGSILSPLGSTSPLRSFEGLENLRFVTGDLDLRGLGELTDLDLPALGDLTGALHLPQNGALRRLALPEIRTVAGALELPSTLAEVDLSALEQVGRLRLFAFDEPLHLELPSLLNAGDFLDARYPGRLASLSLPFLRSLETVQIVDAPELVSLDLGESSGLDVLSISDAPVLREVAVRGGPLIDTLVLQDLPSLTWMDPLTSAIGFQQLVLRGTGLTAVPIDAESNTSTSIELRDNPALASLSGLEALAELGTLTVENNPSLTSLAAFERVERAGAITLRDNGLRSLEGLAGVLSAGDIVVSEPALEAWDGFDALETAANVEIVGCAAMTSVVGPPNLRSVDLLRVADNPALASLTGFEGLVEAWSVEIENNDVLDVVDALSGLRSVNRRVRVVGDAITTLAGFDAIEQTAWIEAGGPSLTTLSAFGALHTVDVLGLHSGPSPPADLGFRSLDHVTDALEFHGFGSFGATLGGTNGVFAAGLAVIGGDAESLVGLAVPESLATDLFVTHTTALTDLGPLADLRVVGGHIHIDYNDALNDLTPLHGLTSVGGSVRVRWNPLLPADAAQAFLDLVGPGPGGTQQGNGTGL